MSLSRAARLTAWWIALAGIHGGALAHASTEYAWSAFGSLGMGRLNRDALVFFDYAGKDLSFNSDSMAGMQFNASADSGLGFTAQVVVRGYDSANSDEEYVPKTEWFFGSWQSGNDLRLRVGRLRIPFFAYSESLEVGYSYPWVRPPTEMYAPLFSRISSMDGANADFYSTWNDYDLTLQVGAGQAKTSHSGYKARFDPLYHVTLSASNGENKFRYGLVITEQDVTSAASTQAQGYYRQFGALLDPVFFDIADSLGAEGVRTYYHSIGTSTFLDDYTLDAEAFYAPPQQDQFTVKSRGGYVSLSRQFNRWTPYVVFGRYHNEVDPSIFAIIDRSEAVPLPPGPGGEALGAQLAALRSATRDSLTFLNSEQRSLTAGVRYDLNTQVALKGAYTFYRLYAPNSGQLDYVDPDNPKDYPTAQLLTLVVDWVL